MQGGDHHRPREIKDRPSACAAHDRPGPSQSPGQNDDKGCTPGLLGRAPPLPLFTTMFLQNFNEDAARPYIGAGRGILDDVRTLSIALGSHIL